MVCRHEQLGKCWEGATWQNVMHRCKTIDLSCSETKVAYLKGQSLHCQQANTKCCAESPTCGTLGNSLYIFFIDEVDVSHDQFCQFCCPPTLSSKHCPVKHSCIRTNGYLTTLIQNCDQTPAQPTLEVEQAELGARHEGRGLLRTKTK